MKSVTIYKFTNEDIEFLKKDLPDNPCITCSDKYSCCECPEGNQYNKAISPYVDKNIYEIARNIKMYKEILATFYDAREKVKRQFDRFPKEIQNILIEQDMIIKEA